MNEHTFFLINFFYYIALNWPIFISNLQNLIFLIIAGFYVDTLRIWVMRVNKNWKLTKGNASDEGVCTKNPHGIYLTSARYLSSAALSARSNYLRCHPSTPSTYILRVWSIGFVIILIFCYCKKMFL